MRTDCAVGKKVVGEDLCRLSFARSFIKATQNLVGFITFQYQLYKSFSLVHFLLLFPLNSLLPRLISYDSISFARNRCTYSLCVCSLNSLYLSQTVWHPDFLSGQSLQGELTIHYGLLSTIKSTCLNLSFSALIFAFFTNGNVK